MLKSELNALLARRHDELDAFDKGAALVYNGLNDTDMIKVGPFADQHILDLFVNLHDYLGYEPEVTAIVFASLEWVLPDLSEQFLTAFFESPPEEDDPLYERAVDIGAKVMDLMQQETIKQMLAMARPDLKLFDMHKLEPGEQVPPGYRVLKLKTTEDGLDLQEVDPDDSAGDG